MDELASLKSEVASLKTNSELYGHRLSDIEQKFDTLETALWKRIWFRINGWPGQRDLNADHPKHRFWHRWLRP